VALDIAEIRRRAEEGNAYNECALGLCYLYGVEIQVDYWRAFGLLFNASQKHVLRACLHLGFMYAHGWGTKRDLREAARLFERVAAEDDGTDAFEACIALGRIYSGAIQSASLPDVAAALQWYAAAITMAPDSDGDEMNEARAYLARYRREG